MLFHLSPIAAGEGYGDAILPLADAKAHLRLEVDDSDDDALVGALRDAAIDAVEKLCGVRLGLTTGLVATFAAFADRLRMPVGPMATVAVAGITYVDGDGAAVTMDAADWRLGAGGYLTAGSGLAGGSWPSGARDVAVTFSAGYPEGSVPGSLLMAVKLMLGHLYKNRDAVLATSLIGELPLGVTMLCAPYQVIGL